MKTLLVVDDEAAVRDTLAACCDEAGYQALTASNGRDAFKVFFEQHPDLVITDIRMPLMNGFELTSRIREVSDVPIIILSAVGREEDIVQGLKIGADDYVVKPAGLQELMARVEAHLRRAQTPPVSEQGYYADQALTINLESQAVFVRGNKVKLTPKELKLLTYLVQRSGKVVAVPELLNGVWGSVHYSEESVKWHIASLRRKVEEDPHEPKLIVTVWGSGYRYDSPKADHHL